MLFPMTMAQAQTSRRGKVLVGPIDLELGAQGVTAIMGPNGSGKTTLLRLMHGTARLTGGQINWACGLAEARHHQSFVFQRPIMLRRSVLDNVAYPLLIRGVAKSEARSRARDWSQRIGLEDALDRQATVLSGGEQQKLALARALITEPHVLFLDEPTAALDGQAKREIEEILRSERDKGTRLFLTTHDVGQGKRLADDVIFLLKGCVQEHSAAAAFFDVPKTTQAQAFLQGDIVE
ncbi:MAG: ATP-binding cassette domain-containing protein [Pseudomonadota bacterium]